MNKNDIIQIASQFVENSEDNYINKEAALSNEVVGMKIYEEPILGFGSAEDVLFEVLKEPQIIGKHFMLPKEWLPQGLTVVSFFLPFSEAVKKGNSRDWQWPSEEWLHARIEGQTFLNKLCLHLKSVLINEGYQSMVPSLDERFWNRGSSNNLAQHPELSFTSNWSERHVAYICGLGTFGLSKGLITRKGVCGRFGSVLTELSLEPDKREYTDVYEYCSMCGACVRNCPEKAISIEKGKNHQICSDFLDITTEKYKPRYGCGKCQVDVPCQSGIPPIPRPYDLK